jgi:hypothetical protein
MAPGNADAPEVLHSIIARQDILRYGRVGDTTPHGMYCGQAFRRRYVMGPPVDLVTNIATR